MSWWKTRVVSRTLRSTRWMWYSIISLFLFVLFIFICSVCLDIIWSVTLISEVICLRTFRALTVVTVLLSFSWSILSINLIATVNLYTDNLVYRFLVHCWIIELCFVIVVDTGIAFNCIWRWSVLYYYRLSMHNFRLISIHSHLSAKLLAVWAWPAQ